MERITFSLVFCLLWASVSCFEHCGKVFNCAADTKTHPFEMEFCPNRFPFGSNFDFTHFTANLPKGLPYQLNTAMVNVEIYYNYLENPVLIFDKSQQMACDELQEQAPFMMQLPFIMFIPPCPTPAHMPFSKSGTYNLTFDFNIPAEQYTLHYEIKNERQDLIMCLEMHIEVYDADTPPENGTTTPYTPTRIVKDKGEEKTQRHVDGPAYTVPVVTNGELQHGPEAHKQQRGDTSVAPNMSSSRIWVIGIFSLSIVIAAY